MTEHDCLRANRSAILREAADIAVGLRQFDPAYGARKSAQISENVGILRVAEALRRRADEAATEVRLPAVPQNLDAKCACSHAYRWHFPDCCKGGACYCTRFETSTAPEEPQP